MKRLRALAGAVVLVGLASAGQASAGDSAELAVDQSRVRLKTGPAIGVKGVRLEESRTLGRVLQSDEKTETIEIEGEAVRIAKPGIYLAGVVESSDEESLTLRIDAKERPVLVPRDAIRSFDVSRGKHSHPFKGIATGLVFGAAAGAAVGFLSGDDPRGFGSFNARTKAAFWATSLGAVGTMAGLVLGGIPSESWEPAPRRLQLAVVPQRRGARVAFSVAF